MKIREPKIKEKITGVAALAKLPIKCTITNAKDLDMTPEEFAAVMQRNAASIRKLGQIDPITDRKNTDA